MELNTTSELISEIKKGRMIVLMDDEDRENEGDLILAADKVNPEKINFMAKHARGLICMAITEEKSKALNLDQMVRENKSGHGTAFTVSIEAASGISTGISAADRAKTIQTAVAKKSKPNDLVQPGHIFPLMAKDGGVLVRAGHTEAGCDLAKLAGLESSAVIVEILNEDGSMARKKDLITFAKKHKLKIGTIEDLIKYKTANEKTIKRISEEVITTDYGKFTSIFYEDTITSLIHFVLIKNIIDSTMPTTVRVHVQNVLTDTIKSTNLSTWPLDSALKKISKSKQGAMVFITENLSTNHINYLKTTKLRSVKSMQKTDDYRTVGIGAQILSDIGVKDMILLSTPKVYHGINAFGLNVIKYISK